MIDTLFCFVTCLVRRQNKEGRGGEEKETIKIKDCIVRNEQKTERERGRGRESSNKDRLPPLLYI
jgi:hypothetical protein